MAVTSLDLHRMGNATSARLDHVRPAKDVIVRMHDGVSWVEGRSGGVSTFSTPKGPPGNWWRLPAGSPYDGALLLVWNDHGEHWSWEPVADMPFMVYQRALAAVNGYFVRV